MREVLIFFLLAAVLVMVARKTRPALDQQGQVIVEPEQWAEVGDVLKVATFNIQTGKNMHGERDVTRAAAVIADADIVGLQEVAAQTWLNKIGVGSAQISKLAQVGEFGYLFAATRRRWFPSVSRQRLAKQTTDIIVENCHAARPDWKELSQYDHC